MPFDGIVLSAVRQELKTKLAAGRIDKIYQPQPDLILMHIRQRTGNYKLLLSAHPIDARVHLTTTTYPNPSSPPLFCMVLRKHLEGGKISGILQKGLERQLTFCVEVLDETGQLKTKHLTIEIMGKHSNIILSDPETSLIIDGIKRFSHAVSRHREVLPGRIYTAPPDQHKEDPLLLAEEDFRQVLLAQDIGSKISKLIVSSFTGFGTVLAQEIIYRCGLEQNSTLDLLGEYELVRLWQEFKAIAETVKTGDYRPSVYYKHDAPFDYAAIQLTSYEDAVRQDFGSVSAAVDCYFSAKKAKDELQSAKSGLTRLLTKELDRNKKKQALQEETVNAAQTAEKYRLLGELITANIYRIKKGMDSVLVENFYDPEHGLVNIVLNPEYTPAQNAQVYFKKYNKARDGAKKNSQHLRQTRAEITYLESVLHSVEEAQSAAEIDDIKNELSSAGYPAMQVNKAEKIAKTMPPKDQLKPLLFKSTSGLTILVGKNNKQNDLLTRSAKGDDIWLHVKDLPGSHVIIKTEGSSVAESALLEAAYLAAYFSKGRYSGQVPVDWTLRKNVIKPSGAKPGQVIYEQHQTIYVTPEEEMVARLKA